MLNLYYILLLGACINNDSKFEINFKLVSTKNLSINNMHLYSDKGAIKKYVNTQSIVKEWSKVRIKNILKEKHFRLKN